MKQVIVFGAGASRSFGVPTMQDFIDVADDMRSSSGEINRAAFDLFFDVIQNRFRQLHAKSSVDLDNIESVFGLVEMAQLLKRLPGFSDDQIVELAAAVRTVLVETIIQSGSFVYTQDHQWTPPDYYLAVVRDLAERLSRQSDSAAVITFNYDLGMDFALHWSNHDIDYGLGAPCRNAIRLYKLHGSLNWVTCRVCGTVRAIPMAEVFRPYSGYHYLHDDHIKRTLDPRRSHQNVGPHCEGDDRPYEVTLVPPSWNKTQYWKQLADVWACAARAIAEAQDITIVGYSLPESDSFFRDLLALGMEGPTRLREFNVVNPDKTVSQRFQKLLGPETRSRFNAIDQTFEDWADRKFGSSPNIRVF